MGIGELKLFRKKANTDYVLPTKKNQEKTTHIEISSNVSLPA